MPTPVKYKNDALRTAYKAVEHESARVMASLQPEELQAETQVWLTGSVLNDAERKILKAAAFRRHQVHRGGPRRQPRV